MLAGAHRHDRMLGVHAGRRRDGHRVDLRIAQHFGVIRVGLDRDTFGGELGGNLLEPVRLQIADRDKPSTAQLRRTLDMAGTDAQTEHRISDVIFIHEYVWLLYDDKV